jgi:hypothetical protein
MPDTSHQINEKMMARWTRKVGWFTGALVIVGLLTAYILYETDQTSRLRDRAFVYFNDPPLTPYPLPPNKPIVWGVGITVVNAGNVPASRIVIQYDCPDAPKSSQIVDPFPLAKWKRAEMGNVIGPKNQFGLQACNIPIEIIEAAKRSERDVFYIVQVTYLDGFYLGKTRVTQMSRKFGFDQWGGQSLGFVGPHNCSDDDCPK